ncbi:MAG: hypothetical protein IJL14_08665 [Selenomonadaceae bacterium]|nr:hypothetical protein [Selenomonadaceae bacterium]
MNGEFYYVVKLDENIRHFFLSGWLGGMDAKVVAIAQLVPKDQIVIDTSTDIKTFEEFIAKIEDAKTKNTIIGNWEVQNYYRNITANDGTIILVDDDGNPILDANGNIQYVKNATRDKEYSEIYTTGYDKSVGITREVYTSAWNMFEDYKVHFRSGTPIRYETIDIFDDVELIDPNLTGLEKYYDNNMKSFGKTNEKVGGGRENNGSVKNPTANGSSVQKTKAAGNSATYNKDGYPYVWQDLDSIDVDFQPEVSWTKTESVYPLQDWDLQFGFDKASNNWVDGNGNSEVGVGAILHQKYNNDGSEKSGNNNREKGGWQDHLRIHSTINFKAPYKVRPTYEKSHPQDTDVLWVRIESEPMFRYPDSKDPDKQIKNHLDIGGLNSVRQIIINFTESNIDHDGNEYRPIVIFYDGPERYSANNSIRDSQPIIVNFAVPVRAIIYAPNSPVVVIGDAADQFQGFIVAKKYLRLKTTEDFEAEINLYDKANDKGEVVTNGQNYRAKEAVDNPYYGTDHFSRDKSINNERDNGEPKTINWLYKKITQKPTDTEGRVVGDFEMYVDDYGNVQYEELITPLTSCGTYDTFGKTEFTSHNYKVSGSSTRNMLLSGVKFDYETNNYNDEDIRYKGTREF